MMPGNMSRSCSQKLHKVDESFDTGNEHSKVHQQSKHDKSMANAMTATSEDAVRLALSCGFLETIQTAFC